MSAQSKEDETVGTNGVVHQALRRDAEPVPPSGGGRNMNDTSIDGVVIPLLGDGAERQTPCAENAQLREAMNAGVVLEQAKGAVSARLGITPDVAFEMLRGLARSQGRTIDEYAAAVVANGGRLDG